MLKPENVRRKKQVIAARIREGFFTQDHETFYTGQGNHFVYCSKKMGLTIVPHCQISRILFDGLVIDIRFDRRVLEFTNPIWNLIYERVCSWIDFPADRSFAVNRCRDLGIMPAK